MSPGPVIPTAQDPLGPPPAWKPSHEVAQRSRRTLEFCVSRLAARVRELERANDALRAEVEMYRHRERNTP